MSLGGKPRSLELDEDLGETNSRSRDAKSALKSINAVDSSTVNSNITNTDRTNFEDSYQLVKHFPDFMPLEYRIASFNQKLLLKGSNSVLLESQIQEMF